MRRSYCVQNYLRAAICRNILFLIVGHDNGHFDLVSQPSKNFWLPFKLWSYIWNSIFFIQNLLPVIDGHLPAGTSVRTGAHFAMNHNSGIEIINWIENLLYYIIFKGETFSAYNYGYFGNLRHYGSLRPPSYDLSKVTSPVYLFYGSSDYLSTSEVL
jgi:hypothetical protein